MIGQKLNKRYKITARLGKGAFGTVYRATDMKAGGGVSFLKKSLLMGISKVFSHSAPKVSRSTRHEVALKVIAGDLAVDPAMLERFKREGEALQALRHPNIVGFIDAFQHAENYVIVMEYVSGGSLHELIKAGPMAIERTQQIGLDLCDALIRAHRLKIIHRDLKPENVLIADDGTPKLADFGIARISADTRISHSGMQFGTPYYMAPEAWLGKSLDAQADIWSLGVVLFEMLAGQVPFGGDTAPAVMTKVLKGESPDLKKLRAGVPHNLVHIITRMLTLDKDQRYQTMREVAVDLERGQPVVISSRTEPDHLSVEEIEREKAEREVIEKAAREKVEYEAAEKARLEAEALAGKKVAKEKADREAAENVRREKARLESEELVRLNVPKEGTERESAKKITWSFSKNRIPVVLMGLVAFFLVAIFGTSISSFLPSSATSTPILTSTRTLAPTATKTKVSTSTSIPTFTLVPASSILYSEDFEDGIADDWINTNDAWEVVNDESGSQVYRAVGPGDYPWSYLDQNLAEANNWTDYAFESRMRIVKGTVFVVARLTGTTSRFYVAVIEKDGVAFADWNITQSGWTGEDKVSYSVQPNEWYTIRFELIGDSQSLYIDGKLIMERKISGQNSGRIGFYIGDIPVDGENEEVYFDDVRVWSLK